jgi:hypothetical protein
MATDLEMKLLTEKIDELTRRLNAKDVAAKPKWSQAAPKNPTVEISGRCVQCNRTAKITTDDVSKGPKGFRHPCPCAKHQEALGGDTTTWHMRTDYNPPDESSAPADLVA